MFGLSLLISRTPVLLGASIAPLLLSVGLDAWLIHRIQSSLARWIHDHASSHLEWIAQIFAWIALFIAGVLAFTFIAGIAALPFNDGLAELTETRATPPLAPIARVSWSGKARLLAIDLFKTLCALFMSFFALVFSWIPGLNLIGIVLAFLLISFQFLSYPQTRRGEGVREGVIFLFAHFWACLGFGMSFAFLFALPVVSSLALPLAVVGGTLLYARSAKSRINGRQNLPVERKN